ncbi:unannotated protein [freshwater metagenome]|uniref:Unannotated protein n=1 Tax=freshwater metagenome TaxID=449393 RepID=A0A6J6I7C7_9ZZZZ
MTEELEPTQQQERDQIAHMEAVGSRVESGVHRNRALLKSFAKGIDCSGVVDQTTSIEIFEDVSGTHRGSLSPVSAL